MTLFFCARRAAAGDAPDNAPTFVSFIWGYEKPQDFLDPLGLDYDEAGGKLYVADTGNKRICVFTRDGMPVDEFMGFRDLNGTLVNFSAPIDVAVEPNGTIFVSDQGFGVVAMDFRGQELFMLDTKQAEDKSISLGRVVVGSDNRLYVGDTTNNQVMVFDANGKFIHKFGRPENAKKSRIENVNGIFPMPERDRIFVTSRSGTAVHIFNYDGVWIGGFGAHENGSMNYSYPSGIVATPDGALYVADMLRSEVKMYTPKLEHIGNFGGIGTGAGAIIYPSDMDIDSEGYIYISEKSSRRVHIFRVVDAGGGEQ